MRGLSDSGRGLNAVGADTFGVVDVGSESAMLRGEHGFNCVGEDDVDTILPGHRPTLPMPIATAVDQVRERTN